MKSKISYFNSGIFVSMLRRFWPIWAIYGLLMLLAMPMVIISTTGHGADMRNALHTLGEFGSYLGAIISFVLAIVVATAVFSFMYSRRSAGLISSLPVHREAVFVSAWLAGLLPFLGINLLIGCITLLVIPGGSTMAIFEGILIWFASFTLMYMTFYGLAVFVAMLTGNIIALPVLYGIFSVLAVCLEMVFRGILSIFIFGFSEEYAVSLDSLSPIIYFINSCLATVLTQSGSSGAAEYALHFSGWHAVVPWGIFGLVLSAASLLLYKRRKMECVGDVIAIRCLRPVFKYGVTICAAFTFALVVYSLFGVSVTGSFSAFFMIFFAAIGAFLGYFGSEMLLKRSFHVFKGTWIGYCIVAGVCAIVILCCDLDVFGIESKLPDASQVEKVTLSAAQYDAVLDGDNIDNVIALQKSITANKAIYYEGSSDYANIIAVTFNYDLKNGGTFSRSYTIDIDLCLDDGLKLEDLLNTQAAVDSRTKVDFTVTPDNILSAYVEYTDSATGEYIGLDLGRDEAYDLYINGIAPDIELGAYGYAAIVSGSRYENDKYNASVSMSLINSSGGVDNYSGIDIVINEDSVNTIQWLRDNCEIDLSSQ